MLMLQAINQAMQEFRKMYSYRQMDYSMWFYEEMEAYTKDADKFTVIRNPAVVTYNRGFAGAG